MSEHRKPGDTSDLGVAARGVAQVGRIADDNDPMTDPDEGRRKPGLAFPDHDSGPTAPSEYKSREREEDRPTRKPLAWWDRVKILAFVLGAWLFLFWAAVTENPLLSIREVAELTARSHGWLLVLAGIEFLRQLHYLISEGSAAYHRLWTQRVFGGWDKRLTRMNDWNRFRIGRALKWLFFLAVIDLVIAAVMDLSPAIAIFQLPAILIAAAPFLVQVVFLFFIVIIQFVGLFWFLSRGGVDVYFPDDIKTRFTDVWGQDSVLEKLKENMLFLEDPESIEKRGGYVPGGILLWGPPGTGKTLMAEAVAGETGRPFVFVDPGAFTNMFLGVGILKVKSLFRKARKLALRYGGVILFFDEADSLGSRGALAQPPGAGFRAEGFLGCNGLSYLQPTTAAMVWHAGGQAQPTGRTRDGVIMGGMGAGM